MAKRHRALAWLTGLGLAGILLGCNWTSAPTASNSPPTTPDGKQGTFDAESGPHAAGKQVVVANGCFRCHTIDGVRGPVGGQAKGRGRGPDLGKVGQDPNHTVPWLMEYVRDPRTHKADAKMPSFEGKIKDNDLRALAQYLASLK